MPASGLDRGMEGGAQSVRLQLPKRQREQAAPGWSLTPRNVLEARDHRRQRRDCGWGTYQREGEQPALAVGGAVPKHWLQGWVGRGALSVERGKWISGRVARMGRQVSATARLVGQRCPSGQWLGGWIRSARGGLAQRRGKIE